MTWAALFAALVRNLPTILALLQRLDQMQREGHIQSKVDESLKQIDQAFKDKDAEKLRAVLNSN